MHRPSSSIGNAAKQARGNSNASGMIDVSVLIVAFRSEACIAACVQSVERAARKVSTEILLVDNGDGASSDLVSKDYPNVQIIPSNGNVGFARANNRLAEHASGEHLLLLNPDACLAEGAIDALYDGANRHSQSGAVGAITLNEHGKPDFGNAIPMPSLTEFASIATGRARASKAIPSSIETGLDKQADVLSGSCLMVRRAAWCKLGGFDERFFLYCEEVDLCRRLSQAGYQLIRVADAKAHHHIAHGNIHSQERRLFQAAGNVEFMRKHWPSWKRWIGIALIWIGAAARFTIGGIIGRDGSDLHSASMGNRLVALNPRKWVLGYHPERGLKAQLDRLTKNDSAA